MGALCMNIFSHIIMGEMLYKSLRKNNIKVSKIAFVYGNIKPDVKIEMEKIPHYKKDIYDTFQKDILEFQSTKVESRSEFNSELSVKLGVICHYISDFFCFAHSENFNNTTWNHFKYEMQLYFYMKKHMKSIRSIKNKLDYSARFNPEKMFDELDKFNIDYLNDYQSKGMDILCSLQNCMSMILTLVNTAEVYNNNIIMGVDDYENSLLYGHILSGN